MGRLTRMEKIKVLVADTQYLVRLGIVKILNGDERFECVGESSNSKELRKALMDTSPDIVTMDYAQGDSFTLEDIKFIQEHAPNTKVLIITSDENSSNVFQAIKYGAISFLTRDCDEEEILSALFSTAKDEKFICHRVVDIIIHKNMGNEEPDCSGIKLTVRELEVLQLTANGMTAKEIASKLFLSLHTVYTHKKNIMRKLDISSSSEMILYAISKGLTKSSDS